MASITTKAIAWVAENPETYSEIVTRIKRENAFDRRPYFRDVVNQVRFEEGRSIPHENIEMLEEYTRYKHPELMI